MSRICIIADQMYKSGGIERVLSHRINYWLKQGDEVFLVTSENKNKIFYFISDSRLSHYDLDSKFRKDISLFHPKNFIKSFSYFYKLRITLNKIKPDVTLIVNYGYDYYFAPMLLGYSYCMKEHHSSLTQDGNGFLNKIKIYYSKLYNAHIFLSQEEADLFSHKNKIVIPNPVINQGDEPLKLNQRQKVVLTAGRIVPIKGYERLINIWSKISKYNTEWRLEIYGDGDLEYVNSLKNLIKENNINESAFIYPSTDKIFDKMLGCQIYAMTSYSECFPMVLLEAMQSKMAIIAFDCPTGPRSILKDGKTGLLVKDNAIDCFSNKLSMLINNSNAAQNLADNAYIDVEKYDLNKVMVMWDKLVHS